MIKLEGRWKAISGSVRDLIVERDSSSGSLIWHIDGKMDEGPFCIAKEPSNRGASFVLEDQALVVYEDGRVIARFKPLE
jgi:hypothetical protein